VALRIFPFLFSVCKNHCLLAILYSLCENHCSFGSPKVGQWWTLSCMCRPWWVFVLKFNLFSFKGIWLPRNVLGIFSDRNFHERQRKQTKMLKTHHLTQIFNVFIVSELLVFIKCIVFNLKSTLWPKCRCLKFCFKKTKTFFKLEFLNSFCLSLRDV